MTRDLLAGQLDEGVLDGDFTSNVDALRHTCAELYARISAFLQTKSEDERTRSTQEQTRKSIGVIQEALNRYSLEELSFSYNGGKDCLVLLILFLAALSQHPAQLPSRLQSVYIVSPHPFPEVDRFVNKSTETYNLDLVRYSKPMKEAFATYLRERPQVKAVFVGTRRSDPHGARLTSFDKTDHGWPDFMRIHPVIDWHYAEIWTFIRELDIPYCPLYDLGYTSLGGTTDTHPNPALCTTAGGTNLSEKEKYRPAYDLVESDEERLGRDR
ncbi:MAG: hypothetical protein M4579_006155 [Chaenotheca gracillima]|nr:MAG: hypothetical protein M4579_006155 [Chaenotheca gracillima]